MGAYVALLRAVNVGGTGKLSKEDLLTAGQDAGFEQVRTYIQSGNLVFTTGLSKGKAAQALQRALAGRLRAQTTLVLRTAPEMEALAAAGPFSDAAPNRVLVYFYDEPPTAPEIAAAECPAGEALQLDGKHLFVHYPNGQGSSKLKVPGAERATARNLNTVRKLAQMVRQ